MLDWLEILKKGSVVVVVVVVVGLDKWMRCKSICRSVGLSFIGIIKVFLHLCMYVCKLI